MVRRKYRKVPVSLRPLGIESRSGISANYKFKVLSLTVTDTYITSETPTDNFSAENIFYLYRTEALVSYGIIKIDITNIPKLSVIKSAKLKIYSALYLSTDQTVHLYTNATDVTIATVTWNTKPTIGDAVTSQSWLVTETTTYKEFDITDIVKAWYAGTIANYGLTMLYVDNWLEGIFNSVDSTERTLTAEIIYRKAG